MGPVLTEPQVTDLLLSSCGDQYWSSESLVWDARDDLICLPRVPSAQSHYVLSNIGGGAG